MDIAVPERHKIPGVCYAVTDDGVELPVIDITHPAFSHYPGPDELAVITRRTLDGFASSSRVPAFVYRWMAGRSVVFRNAIAARGSFLPGIPTYLQKLAPETLGRAWAGRLDRKLLGLIGPVCMRLRLRDASLLLADAIGDAAEAVAGALPLNIVSIAGGTAIECLNALIVVHSTNPALLAGRPVTIHVFDPDASAAAFGSRALQELLAPGGRMHGVSARLAHVPYDWRRPRDLRDAVVQLSAQSPLLALSSEGGLFEYGSDDEIGANLAAVREAASPDTAFVATVLRDNEVGRAMRDYGNLALCLRERGALDALVGAAGWAVTRSCDDGPLYHVVSLSPIAPCGAH